MFFCSECFFVHKCFLNANYANCAKPCGNFHRILSNFANFIIASRDGLRETFGVEANYYAEQTKKHPANFREIAERSAWHNLRDFRVSVLYSFAKFAKLAFKKNSKKLFKKY